MRFQGIPVAVLLLQLHNCAAAPAPNRLGNDQLDGGVDEASIYGHVTRATMLPCSPNCGLQHSTKPVSKVPVSKVPVSKVPISKVPVFHSGTHRGHGTIGDVVDAHKQKNPPGLLPVDSGDGIGDVPVVGIPTTQERSASPRFNNPFHHKTVGIAVKPHSQEFHPDSPYTQVDTVPVDREEDGLTDGLSQVGSLGVMSPPSVPQTDDDNGNDGGDDDDDDNNKNGEAPTTSVAKRRYAVQPGHHGFGKGPITNIPGPLRKGDKPHWLPVDMGHKNDQKLGVEG